MKRKKSVVFLVFAPLVVAADGSWVLATSTVTYHVSHALHQSEGVSHAARGKGICQGGQCNFLIGVSVKSFESGDTNRDIDMIQAARGALFPQVSVRVSIPEAALTASSFKCDLQIEFAGQTMTYRDMAFRTEKATMGTRVTGTIPATLADFKIDAPSVLAIPVKNEMPIQVDMTWRPGT